MRDEAAGFSLIETLVAATIVVVGLTGLAQLFIVSSAANARSKVATQSTILAHDKMEELIAPGADDDDAADFLDSLGHRLAADGPQPREAAYVRHWFVRPLSDRTGAKLVIVLVARVGRTGEDVRIVGVRPEAGSQ